MAARASSTVGSPPAYEDPPAHEWELLSMSTMCSSALLAHNGLGFGLPPISTLRLHQHTGATDETEDLRRDVDSDAGNGILVRSINDSSVALDVSQIAVMCTSTSNVEPFTEGWKPQFRIVGASLQDNYYSPFATATTSNEGSSLEPFMDMEQSFLKEAPSIATDTGASKPLQPDTNQGLFAQEVSVKAGKHAKESPTLQEKEDELLPTQEKVRKNSLIVSELADTSKTGTKKVLHTQGKCSRQNGHGFFYRRSYVAWTVALTTALLGVFLIAYCSETDRNEMLQDLSTGEEKLSNVGHRESVKEAVLRRWKMGVT